MIKQVFEKDLWLAISECLSCNASGDVRLLSKLFKMSAECILAHARID